MRRTGIVAFLWRLTRTTSIVVALAVMLALVAGVASIAVAQKKPPPGSTPPINLLLNVVNSVTAFTSMEGSIADPILRLVNNGTGPALDLKVQSGKAPMTVNSDVVVNKLHAETAEKAADSDKLDGKDSTDFALADSGPGSGSTALGVTTKTNHQKTGDCVTALSVDNECAPVQVTVPTGKQYNVRVFSSFVVSPWDSTADPTIFYCPAVKGGSYQTVTCMYGEGAGNFYDVLGTGRDSLGVGSGEIANLPEGTYTFSTDIHPTCDGCNSEHPVDDSLLDKTHTTVLVTDASAPGPPIE